MLRLGRFTQLAPMTPSLPSEPILICGYTEDQWELWNLREEVKRLQAENAWLSGAAHSDSIGLSLLTCSAVDG